MESNDSIPRSLAGTEPRRVQVRVPDAREWCIGQSAATVPWTHRQSGLLACAADNQSSAGTNARVAVRETSHSAATNPSARRWRLTDNPE